MSLFSTLLLPRKTITVDNQWVINRYAYPDPGSNRDGLPHWCLRPARLPIPPSGLNCGCKDTVFFLMRQTFYKKVAHAEFSEKIIFSTLTWPIATSQKGVEAMRIGGYQHHTARQPYFQRQKKWCCKRKMPSNSWLKQKTQRMKTKDWTDVNRKSNGWKQKTQRMKTENSPVEIIVFSIRNILTTMPNTRLFAIKQVIGHK